MPNNWARPFRRLSIRAKLLLIISGLLMAVTGMYSWVTYREMRASAFNAAEARLDGIATQWAALLANSRQQQLALLRRLRDSTEVRAIFMDSATPPTQELRALMPLDSSRRVVQIVAADGRELVRLGPTNAWAHAARHPDLLQRAAGSDSGATTALLGVGDSVRYAHAMRIVRDGATLGYLVEWRRLGGSNSAARDQLNRLFGSDTRVLVSNATGDVTSDLSQRVWLPNVQLDGDTLLRYVSQRRDVLARAEPVAGTSWTVVIEHDVAAALALARQFLGRTWIIGALAILLGALCTLALSVSITEPLERLTSSAERVAAGAHTPQAHAAPGSDEVGRLAASFETMVTRVQHSLLAHRVAEERYRRLFEAAPLPHCVIDRESLRLIDVNEAMVAHYGYSRDELLALSLPDLHRADDEQPLREMLRTPGDGSLVERTWQHMRKDGSVIDVEVSGHGVTIDGRAAYVALLLDVTDRNRAAEALRQSEARYRRLLSEAPIGVTLSDSHGRFLLVNNAFATMLGHDGPGGVVAQPVAEVFASREQHSSLLARLLDGRRINREEVTLLHRGGTLVTARLTGQPVQDGSLGRGLIEAVWEDVTEQQRVERQFHQAQKMEAVGRLAGGVAHDFNNLLTIIISSADLVLADLPSDSPHWPDVEAIRTAGKSAAALTRQLLAFSRKQVLQPREVPLNDLVTSTAALLERLLADNIELKTVLAPHTGLVKVDPGQLEQVLVNLAVNAQDAMPNGGQLLIESRHTEFDEPVLQHNSQIPAGRYVVLSVSDTGIGMDSDTMARIFEPFFTTKSAGEGTGLGLATVYGIVRQSGGFISVYSEPGVGSTFKIYFPRLDTASLNGRTPAHAVPSQPGSETVLVVEDAEPVRKIMRQVLQKLGYFVLEATDGESALAVSAEHVGPIHLLLTDVLMPRMGGRTLAQHLAAKRPETRVLFVSGYTDDAIVRHGVLEPGIHYLEKPFTPDALARKVRAVLDGARASVND
jgi:two-component system, cell cycle sensor histidine kinase and response regulator CckA